MACRPASITTILTSTGSTCWAHCRRSRARPTPTTRTPWSIVTSIFRRTGYKYRDRAYRYVSADAGHLLENLRVAGQAAGMQAQPAARFDEARLARAIGVDGVEEGVLAVMALRRGGAARAAPHRATSRRRRHQTPRWA